MRRAFVNALLNIENKTAPSEIVAWYLVKRKDILSNKLIGVFSFMLKYYYNNSPSYKRKVKSLIVELERVTSLDGLEIIDNFEYVFPEKYTGQLEDKEWKRINQLYYSILQKSDTASSLLAKFLTKKGSPQKKFRMVDTFAGAGGLSKGLENAGFNTVFVNDFEDTFLETHYFNRSLSADYYSSDDINVLLKNFSTVKNKLDSLDLLVGGPPCQGFSMANRQRLLNDPRNVLYKSFLDLLRQTQPKFFIMENVKGMMNKSNEIISDFQQVLGSDYTVEITLINAKDYGVPQNRERVFVIGSRLKNVPASTIVKDILSHKQQEQQFVLKDALEGLPRLYPKKIKHSPGTENKRVGYTYSLYDYKKTNYEKYINIESTHYLSNHTNRYNNERDVEIFSRLPQGENSLHESIKDIMPYSSRNHIFKDKYYRLAEATPSKTITSHMKFDCNMYIHPTEPRGISPREAARVQTFPDDYVFKGAKNNWYAQIGNAVPVKVAELIGKSIHKHLK